MNKEELIEQVNKTFKYVNQDWVKLIDSYKIFLTEYNKKINLTNLDDKSKIYGSYFYDSIIPYKNIDFNTIHNLLDIGSGSGIPGIVLKILYPHLSLDIIESNNKKVTFLKLLVEHLNLKNVNVILKRAEMIKPNEYEKYDLVTSRAVGKLKVMMELSIPYAKVRGIVIIPKGPNVQSESSNLNILCNKLNVKYTLDTFVSLTGITHNVFCFTKTKPTNRIYPRSWNKIIKEYK